jgi:hypothetical protein
MKHMSLCENEENSKWGTDKKIVFIPVQNCKSQTGGQTEKKHMSICEKERKSKGGRTKIKKIISSLNENENLKRGDRQKI